LDFGCIAWQFFEDNNVALAGSLSNNPELFIAETGWPTKSSDAEHATNGASDASVANLQVFIDTWICQANNNGTKYL
jgi:exo-beta-1,3-glucanase (GH17 family)